MTVNSEVEGLRKMNGKKERSFLVFIYDKQHRSEKALNTFDWRLSQEHRYRVYCVMRLPKVLYISAWHDNSALDH